MSPLVSLLRLILRRPSRPPASASPGPPGPTASMADAVVPLLNAGRSARGLAPLAPSPVLAAVAQAWAASMARDGILTHGGFAGRIAHAMPGSAGAEDIADGQRTAEAAVAAWMASPAHRANILGPYDLAGAGCATAADGTVFWCADFARGPA